MTSDRVGEELVDNKWWDLEPDVVCIALTLLWLSHKSNRDTRGLYKSEIIPIIVST